MKVKRVIEILEANGWVLLRQGKGDHAIYLHTQSGSHITIDGKPSREVPTGTLATIRRHTGIKELR